MTQLPLLPDAVADLLSEDLGRPAYGSGRRLADEWHAQLLRWHGQRLDRTCRGCAHLIRHSRGRTWLKCRAAGETGSAASDWRAGWQACGLYES